MQDSEFTGRTLARSQALQVLFQAEATGRSVDDVLDGDYALSQGPLDPYGEQLARGAGAMIPALDRALASASENWSVWRMPSVDRNLLRLATYEMCEVPEVAVAVSIAESVELAKAYGTDDSSKFVNGVLGHIADQIEKGVDPFDAPPIADETEDPDDAEAENVEAESGAQDEKEEVTE